MPKLFFNVFSLLLSFFTFFEQIWYLCVLIRNEYESELLVHFYMEDVTRATTMSIV